MSMALDGVTSFSSIKKYEIHVNAPVTVKVLCGISFHVIVENWNRNTVLSTSDLYCIVLYCIVLYCIVLLLYVH